MTVFINYKDTQRSQKLSYFNISRGNHRSYVVAIESDCMPMNSLTKFGNNLTKNTWRQTTKYFLWVVQICI